MINKLYKKKVIIYYILLKLLKMIVVSGASDNHFKSLCNFINSFLKHRGTHKLIVYNLGVTEQMWNSSKERFKNDVDFKIFDYTKYPSWYNINKEAGQYAWKSAIIKEVYEIYPGEKIVWMDSGNLIKSLEPLNSFLSQTPIYSAVSSGNILKWTVPETIKYLNCKDTSKKNRNAACIGFNTNINYACDMLNDFVKYCSIRECIAPDGSSRTNHRQDQAIFTIIYYDYHMKYKYHIEDKFLGYTIHNDVG